MHLFSNLICLFPLVLLLLGVVAFDPTEKPKRPPPETASPTPAAWDNPIKKPPRNTQKAVHVRVFSRIPEFESAVVPGRKFPSSLVGLTSYGKSLYVTTSSAGAYIYRVFPSGRPFLWANIQEAVLRDTGRNVNCETAQHGGLRSVAFPRDHRKTGLFYVSFMEDRPLNDSGKPDPSFTYLSKPADFKRIVADSVVAEFRYDFATRQVVNGSYRAVVRIGLETKDHPIKQITFQGNYLLIAHGDGAQGSNPSPGGMNNDALGKILRIDPKIPVNGTKPYSIPPSNPFVDDPQYLDEIYAVGFRNPHNLCWSKQNGLFVADVGRDNIEEVNLVEAGGNYGWGEREGTFVNLYDGGNIVGISPLPMNDAENNYTYPVVQLGHWQPTGGQIKWGIAIAGSCPIETHSPLNDLYFYANFAKRGDLYYSYVSQMKSVRTKGPRDQLQQANVYRSQNIQFDHDNDPSTPPKKLQSLLDLVREDSGNPRMSRVDARFGRGPRGEIYITSKRTGTIYLITSSLPDAKQ